MAPSSIEKPTLIERFVSLIPLPYPLAALIWSAFLPGSPGFYLATLTPLPAYIPTTFLNMLLFLYLFLIVRYMRLRIVAAETPIASRLALGGQDYHRAFGRIASNTPIILLTAGFGTLILAVYATNGLLSTIPLLVGNTVTVYLASLAFSSYLWIFATASLGLHKLGGSLKLQSFVEDRMMGARPMGNLALSLTAAYYGGLLLTLLLFRTFPTSSLALESLFIIFLLLGVALFFLPLDSIHARMQAEKRRLLREIGARYPRLELDPSRSRDHASQEDLHSGLARLTDLQELEMLDRKAASLPTWPFDIQVVSKFVTIVLSVTAVILSRLVTGFLHI